ncbi:purine/pyrimidine permease [Paenibacillus sp. N1-5-1-14]|uniref:purine/pyrimidine permease n=1 Tax=Paenibacillus radicibacter TaxID=2972488 RepID=UPI002158D775|nr:purine/pyrimidine permease [Paenibacillus radicibacter]MCR8643255.1 purine/pyrimidine permease [Paenibacillus radicibacter]
MENKRIIDSFSTVQWFIFLLANAVALPIVIGGIFQLSFEQITTLMQRTFFVVGISSFIQGLFGHKYPIADGPAGSWVSIFVILGNLAMMQGQDQMHTLQILEGGLIVAGLFLFLLGATKLVYRLQFLFTPLVAGLFLLILALQLSGVLLKGMLGVQGAQAEPDFAAGLISFFICGLVIALSIKGRGWIRSYAVLIGISLGWGLFAILGKIAPTSSTATFVLQFPQLFAWGAPRFDIGIVITSLLFTFLLVSNTIAAIAAVRQVVPASSQDERSALSRGIWTGGISHMIAALFSTIGVVPLPASAGFMQITGQKRIHPFLIASLLLSGIALIPSVVNKLALLPGPIASSALLATFVQIVGIAFQSILREKLDHRRLTIVGITLLVSIGIMFLPANVFQSLPSTLRYICSNGLLVGTMLAIGLEQLWISKEE